MGALQQRRRGAASGKVAGAAQPRARQRRACPRVRCGAHRVGRTTRNGVRGGVKFDRPALARSNAIVAGSDAVFAPHHFSDPGHHSLSFSIAPRRHRRRGGRSVGGGAACCTGVWWGFLHGGAAAVDRVRRAEPRKGMQCIRSVRARAVGGFAKRRRGTEKGRARHSISNPTIQRVHIASSD